MSVGRTDKNVCVPESGIGILPMNSLKHRMEADATPIPVSYLKDFAAGSFDSAQDDSC